MTMVSGTLPSRLTCSMNSSGTPRFCRRRVRADHARGVSASNRRRYILASPPGPEYLLDEQPCCLVEHFLAEHRHQHVRPCLTWVPLVTGPTLSM